jgi:high-affinity iron transporter
VLTLVAEVDGSAKTGKWVLFVLPLITVLREGQYIFVTLFGPMPTVHSTGMEAVVFVGGVSLGQPAASIPIAAIVGLICGLIIGFLIYEFASRTSTKNSPLARCHY